MLPQTVDPSTSNTMAICTKRTAVSRWRMSGSWPRRFAFPPCARPTKDEGRPHREVRAAFVKDVMRRT